MEKLEKYALIIVFLI